MRVPNRLPHAGVLPLVVSLAGCSLIETPKPADLALACQTRPCVCEAIDAELFTARRTADVSWRLNGDAYCAEGYRLKRGSR